MKNPKDHEPKPNFFLSLLFSEGGFSTLVILPIVIIYFFRLAL